MRIARSPVWLVFLMLACAGCAGSATNSVSRSVEARQPTTTPTHEQLTNLTYYGIDAEPVQLTDGRWEGPPFVEGGPDRPRVELVAEMTRFGDLNGDGIDDAALLLTSTSSANGDRVWVAAVGAPLGRPSNYGCSLVGAGSQIRSMEITGDGWIHLEVIEPAAGDPRSGAPHRWKKDWALYEGELIQVSALVVEPLSPAVLRSGEWTLTHLGLDEPAPAEPRITVLFDRGKVTGSAACNRYFADFAGGEPGTIEIGPVGSTKRACPPEVMAVEQKFLERLQTTRRYGFEMRRLALDWQSDDQSGTMLLEPVPED